MELTSDHPEHEFVYQAIMFHLSNLLDCFNQWDGKGSLKAFCERLYRQGLLLIAAADAPPGPLKQAAETVWRDCWRLLRGESETGLLAARETYLADPMGFAEMLVRKARRGEVLCEYLASLPPSPSQRHDGEGEYVTPKALAEGLVEMLRSEAKPGAI